MADLKPALAKCPVVTDAVQQFVNRRHGSFFVRSAEWTFDWTGANPVIKDRV
jgi:hypothetical protein